MSTYHQKHAHDLLLRLKGFWESQDFTDVQLDINGRVINGHKAVLAAGSPLIRHQLLRSYGDDTDTDSSNRIELHQPLIISFSDVILMDLVTFIYTLELLINEHNYKSLSKLCYLSEPALAGKGIEDSCNEYYLLKEDTLERLEGDVTPLGEHRNTEVQHHDSTFPASLLKSMNDQRESHLFTDVTIQVAGENFPCHRVVLSACSTFFRAMFSSNMVESDNKIVRLQQIVDLELFRNIMEFTYTGKLLITLQNAQDLISLASYLHYHPVITACSEFFKKNLEPDNCISFMNFAQSIGCYEIYNDALNYVYKHFLQVCNTCDFLEINPSTLMRIIENDHLNIKKEEVVFDAVLQWYGSNQDKQEYFGDILRKVRLPLLDIKYFSVSVEQNPVILNHEECMEIVKDAKMLRDAPEGICDDRLRLRLSMTTEVMIIIGGFDSEQQWIHDVWCCNLIDNSWTSLAPFPGRNQRFACVSLNNDVYVIGGQVDYHANLSETLADVWRYESLTDKWSQVASLNKPRHNHGVAVLNGKIYVVGGRTGWSRKSNDVERYDPVLNIWTYVNRIKGSFLERPVVTSVNGKLFVNGYFFRDPDIIHCYDPADDCWSAIFNFERVHGEGIETAVVINDFIFYLVSRGDENELIIFNPFTSERIRGSSIPDGRYLYSYGTTVLNEKIIVSGGSKLESAVNVSDIKCYDPNLNMWSQVGSLPQPLTEHGCVCIEKYIPTLG
ncbi:kelch-like protein 24 [Antedon mediterranea]|uniref:kelch-like protein 24 n=1 Tax=Antedon mediterranea TaxID=105859 RepID=UPI003AF8D50D